MPTVPLNYLQSERRWQQRHQTCHSPRNSLKPLDFRRSDRKPL
jgi:hypothetical protein